jgi:hypothetical protein
MVSFDRLFNRGLKTAVVSQECLLRTHTNRETKASIRIECIRIPNIKLDTPRAWESIVVLCEKREKRSSKNLAKQEQK